MRQTISGMVAAVAVMLTMSVAPASACYYASACAPAPVYVAPVAAYSGCYGGCGGWARERLPDPVHQYYYVNQGPTYTGPGNWAPRPVYQETSVSYGRPYYDGYRARPHYGYRYSVRPSVGYGYAPRHGYMPRHSMRHHGAMMHRHHGHRHHGHALRRYN
ncbi:hypothetical protein [Bradyrhizobium sp.]|uniref:hypothetical protein n=1 Tax=Bradyrhizobium sp. TaxID=376 RepID=UPI0025C54752|nr:hypothetical protein [Bradyrhizobium sp.]